MAFLKTFVSRGPRSVFDHYPIIISTHGKKQLNRPATPFRFHAMWLYDNMFKDFVESKWNKSHDCISKKTSRLAKELQIWNQDIFICIFKRKMKVLVRLNGIQKCIEKGP